MKLISKFLLLSRLLKLFAQTEIVNNSNQKDDTVESISGGETVRFLKNVDESQVSVQCNQNNMCIKIQKQFLKENSITTFYDKLQLQNTTKNCGPTYTNAYTDPNWESASHVELCTTSGFLSCGTRMEMNDTHVSYINQIITKNEESQTVGKIMTPVIREYVIPWHCVYRLEYIVGLETGFSEGYYIPKFTEIQQITLKTPALQKETTFPVFMQLFDSPNFRTPFSEAPILKNTDKLYVQVKMIGPESSSIQMLNCWATPFGGLTDNELNNYRFNIIEDYCVTNEAKNSIAAKILRNGRDQTGQYEANVFKYRKEVLSDRVYLHCNVKVCFNKMQKCDVAEDYCAAENPFSRKKERNYG